MFKNNQDSFSGDMTMQIFKNSDFKLSVYAPIIGTLIFSLLANSEEILVLNFKDGYFLNAKNNQEIRKKWFGMDLSKGELKWLMLGEFPYQKKIKSNRYKIIKESKELVFNLNQNGKIEKLEKYDKGILEYRAEIPLYKNLLNKYIPKIIKIEDFYKINQWKILISEIKIQNEKLEPLNFNPPDILKKFNADH